MNMKDVFVGLICFLIGVLIISYEYKKRRKEKEYRVKSYQGPRGYIAGCMSILFGIYLIFQSLNL